MPEFNQEDHVVRQPTTNQLFDKRSSPIVMDVPNNDQFGVDVVEDQEQNLIPEPKIVEDNGYFEHSERTDWSSLDAYKDKEIGSLLEPKHTFLVEYVQDIIQQGSDTLDCGLFVASFVEFLSDEIPIQSNNIRCDDLRSRYAALLWKYGSEKAEAGYVSDNDDPSEPTGHFTPPDHDVLVNLE
uniref:Ulp1 protease family, C-terminal catalytic domain containing protein n=1 Tax=Solanum tuberosum TaxID=4113 RepID=M1B3U1_SOLTU